MMSRNEKQNQKGITLISLVITVIILLILAAVAISIAVDSNGLFKKAGDAANKWNHSVGEEERIVNELLAIAEKQPYIEELKYIREGNNLNLSATAYEIIPLNKQCMGELEMPEGATYGFIKGENGIESTNQGTTYYAISYMTLDLTDFPDSNFIAIIKTTTQGNSDGHVYILDSDDNEIKETELVGGQKYNILFGAYNTRR